jgi:cephalosporin hydroxylase
MILDRTEDETLIEKKITDAFHLMYYNSSHTWNGSNTKWMGVPCFQNPLDMWIFQEIIFETKPTIIIECGSFMGGSSQFFAHMMDNADIFDGRVISIDVGDKSKADHPRVLKLSGKSTSSLILKWINEEIRDNDKVMVVLDSDHSTENVLSELRIYAPIVTLGCYLVVMDSNLGGNPIHIPEIGPGPMTAIEQFMKGNSEFEIDKSREKFYFTFCPNGWLRKKEK